MWCHRQSPDAGRPLGEAIEMLCDLRIETAEGLLLDMPAESARDASAPAYDRARFLDERQQMMQDWADYLDRVATTGKVIHMDFAQAAE